MVTRTFRRHQKFILILAVYLVLAVGYSLVVPIGRGADEWAHYWYAQFIADHDRLPLNPAERDIAGYKSDWPPLYHLFVAGLTGWVETEGPPTFKYRADNVRRQLVSGQGPEAILHTEDELFPWQQEVLVWHLGRFLSIVFAVGVLVVTYFLAREVFGRVAGSRVAGSRVAGSRVAGSRVARYGGSVQTLALVAVGLLAFNPRFVFTGMVFGYDSLTLFLATLFLWLSIRVVKGFYSKWGFWGLGLLAGLALTTKYLAALLPLEIVVVALLGWQAGRITSIRQTAIRVGQAALAYLVTVSWWVAYLLGNFNQIETYGPVLGTLAPLLRGDGSDRTVEELFAWLSGGQAPPPAYIERQVYSAWQVIAELPLTFWGNPITRPYPLDWFIVVMTIVSVVAIAGLVVWWRTSTATAKLSRSYFILLACHTMLAVPFMLIRLFGARDALEAVQGRHLLFLSGPAIVILLVWGLSSVKCQVSSVKYQVPGARCQVPDDRRWAHYGLNFMFYSLPALLLVGSMGQLIFMRQTYPPLLPVQTTPYLESRVDVFPQVTLNDQARLIDVVVAEDGGQVLQVDLIWHVADTPLPEDYRVELALVDAAGQMQAGWLAYQTQARYPSRAWEAGDTVRDEGWLPLLGLAAGEYQVRLRLLGQAGPLMNWQPVADYTFARSIPAADSPVLWYNGKIARRLPVLQERESVQLTGLTTRNPQLFDPDGIPHEPEAAGNGWANFIVAPDWPAGDYTLEDRDKPVLRVAPSRREFRLPEIAQPVEANFVGKIKLLGYDLPTRRVEPGQGLTVVLYWQSLDWLGEEFVMFTRLLDNTQVAWGGRDRLAQENYSTLLWAPGEIIIDPLAVQVDPATPDGVYTLNLGWYQVVDGQAQSLPVLHPETGEPTGSTSVNIGPVKVGGPPAGVTVAAAKPEYPLQVLLGDKIELLGYDLARTNTAVDLVFYWQAVASVDTDYTVFVHILDQEGNTVAQKDSPPVGGTYPTGLWDAGEIIRDEILVPVVEWEPGIYEVVVGMYDFESGQRLAVAGSADGAILLQWIEIYE